MANKIPFTNYSGQIAQMQAGDVIDPAFYSAGGTIPTGTGFTHITAGAQDAAAKLVDTADISNAAVTLGKMANLAANSIMGNNTGSTATPIALTGAQVKSFLALNNVENTALSSWGGSANLTTVGTIGTGTWSATAIAANKGGTGQTTYAVGDLLYASTTSALSKLAAVATGNVLISGGANTAFSWGKVALTTHVSGTLPVANGGTGVTTSTGSGNNVLSASPTFTGTVGAAAITATGTVTSGNVFASSSTNIILSQTGAGGGVYLRPNGSGSTTGQAIVASDGVLTANGVSYAKGVNPLTDNTYSCGTASFRYTTVYATTSTINTSDARDKTPVRRLTVSEINAAKQIATEIGGYRWLAQITAKGSGAREHIGMTVQRCVEIMVDNGLDAMRYGFICYDEWEEIPATTQQWDALEEVRDKKGGVIQEAKAAWVETIRPGAPAGNSYGFRMDELIMFVLAGIEARLAALEAALT